MGAGAIQWPTCSRISIIVGPRSSPRSIQSQTVTESPAEAEGGSEAISNSAGPVWRRVSLRNS